MEIQTTNTQLKRQLQSQKHTINHSVVIQLPESDDELYEQIRRYKEMAEAAKTQLLPAKPNQFKCRHCAVRASCRDRAA